MLEGIGEIMKIRFRDRFSSAGVSRSGSALLIVLGFLSFMIISGVSFAIYMRIERQASSNYKHAVNARHLLNASLARAIDEIDSELRITTAATSEQTKFPPSADWPGRVKVSAVENSDLNNQDAHVLSLEALGFLPAILINDVRRYAVRSMAGPVDPAYKGPKWRQLERGTDDEVVGRYAYVCVNVSDMLDMNLCSAMPVTNSQVCIGHLFENDQDRKDLDADRKADSRYFSLPEFYAARYARDKTAQTSPFQAYVDPKGSDQGKTTVFAPSSANDRAKVKKQVYGTDSIFKPDPLKSGAVNISKHQPVDPLILNDPLLYRSPVNKLMIENTFWGALSTMTDPVMMGAHLSLMAAQLADYLDFNSVPKQLGIPSVEMIPMISKIVINNGLLKSQVYQGPDSADTPPQRQYGIQLINRPMFTAIKGGNQYLAEVQVVYPFKYFLERLRQIPSSSTEKKFYLMARMCFKIVKDGVTSNSSELTDPSVTTYPVEFESTKTEIDLTTLPRTDGSAADNSYYVRQGLKLALKTPEDQNEVLLVKLDDTGKPTALSANFSANDQVRVACTILVQVLDENDNAVDQVPCLIDPNPSSSGYGQAVLDRWKQNTPKLYYATDSIAVNRDMQTKFASGTAFLEYGQTATTPNGYTSLEIPDPRFNHAAMNWIASQVVWSPPTGAGAVNASTRALLGQDGRDSDIFMSVSDSGIMQSPGELGFLLRPYQGYILQAAYGQSLNKALLGNAFPAVDFFTQQSVVLMNAMSDRDAMFRTFRLYDHGAYNGSNLSERRNRQKDDVYGRFYVMKEDGTLPGAHVNPLSDIPAVRDAAIWDTPLNFWFFAPSTPDFINREGQTFNRRTFHFAEGTPSLPMPVNNPDPTKQRWERFHLAWTNELVRAVTLGWEWKSNENTYRRDDKQDALRVNKSWRLNVADVYGNWDLFRWYSPNPLLIFGDNETPAVPQVNLDNPLHEVDRKMLYAHSLDAFSDRQQLFLLFLRAEATVPSFGGVSEGGMRSLAGGRAVALVWRDPYPQGYDKGTGLWKQPNNQTVGNNDPAKKVNNEWYPANDLESPWVQYYPGRRIERWNGYHETRILYFKQLDQ